MLLFAIFGIAYGVYMYSVRNDKEKQQEINNNTRHPLDPKKYNLSRGLTCGAFLLIALGLFLFLLVVLFPLLINSNKFMALMIGGFIVIPITYLIALLTYARKKDDDD
ncbi:MAG: hypothetical protein ACI4UO_03740 [Paludibacteraceae bacterium]